MSSRLWEAMESSTILRASGSGQVRTVGRGSFGEALLVKHRSTGQLSVLKRVRLEAGATANW